MEKKFYIFLSFVWEKQKMNYFIKIFIMTIMLLNVSYAYNEAYSLGSIIEQFEKENDLSKNTKQESLGHVIVYTRQEIEELGIKNLEDLVLRLPLLKYTQTNQGLADLGYLQKGRISSNLMKIYIDNQPLAFPYQGTGLKFYSKISLHFVDHIELYWGFPSFKLDANSAASVIKIYSKKPSRENSTTVGARVSNKGGFSLYGYSAHQFDDFSYLLSIDKSKQKQSKEFKYKNYPFSKNQDTSHLFASFSRGDSKFSINALQGDYGGFIGESVFLKPVDNNINLKHLYLNYNYEDENDFKLSLGYSYANTKTHNKNFAVSKNYPIPLKYLMPEDFPVSKLSKKPTKPLGLYEKNLHEYLLNINLSKRLNYKNHSMTFGYRGQHKNFKFDKYVANGIELRNSDFNYKQELTSSLYAEDSYLLDEKNLLISSIMYSYFDRKHNVKNRKTLNAHLGYIHNEKNWYNKLFFHYGQNNSDTYLFSNYFLAKQPKKTTERIISNELGYKFKDNSGKTSLMLGYVNIDEKRPNHSSIHKFAVLNLDYKLNSNNYFKSSYWFINSRWSNNLYPAIELLSIRDKSPKTNRYGGHIALNSSFNKFSITNMFYLVQDTKPNKSYFDYNLGINYSPTRNLEFSLQGVNLLNKGYASPFYGVSDKKPEIVVHKDTLLKRAIWFGVEYSF